MIDLASSLASIQIDFLQQPPWATLFILGLTLVINIAMSFANRRVMDLEAYRRMMIESARVRKEVMEAMKSGNQRRISKAQNRQQELMKQQQQMSMGRLKLTLYFFIPFILIWTVLRNFFGNTIIAYMPFKAPFFNTEMSIGNWYILCSISINIVLSRIMGLTFEIDPDESV
ncbi:MAG: EMC3/TMCO1 family protein [Candidatus Bathyarchaeota archaeon]|jgi:uncharacterized membrane protein (DUF106 family)